MIKHIPAASALLTLPIFSYAQKSWECRIAAGLGMKTVIQYFPKYIYNFTAGFLLL